MGISKRKPKYFVHISTPQNIDYLSSFHINGKLLKHFSARNCKNYMNELNLFISAIQGRFNFSLKLIPHSHEFLRGEVMKVGGGRWVLWVGSFGNIFRGRKTVKKFNYGLDPYNGILDSRSGNVHYNIVKPSIALCLYLKELKKINAGFRMGLFEASCVL